MYLCPSAHRCIHPSLLGREVNSCYEGGSISVCEYSVKLYEALHFHLWIVLQSTYENYAGSNLLLPIFRHKSVHIHMQGQMESSAIQTGVFEAF